MYGRDQEALPGEGVVVENRYCTNCGHELVQEYQFCPGCGRPIHQTAQVPTPEADVQVPTPPRTQQPAAPTLEQGDAQPQGRSMTSRVLLGCLGVFVLLFLLVGCLAILAGGGGEEVAEEPRQVPADQAEEARQEQQPEEQEPEPQPEPEPPPEPEPEPEPEPAEPRPITLSGSGPEATSPFQLESGLTVIRMSHQGDANFIVDLLDENGNSVAPMGVANVIGPFQGSTPVQIQRGGQHLLDVQAAGQWQITVEQPRAANAPAKTSFSGNSAQATQLFELSGGLHRVEMTHQGDANFIVDLLDENGASVVPMGLVNEIGPFEGSRAMQVPEDGIYLFSVQANGPWTIRVE